MVLVTIYVRHKLLLKVTFYVNSEIHLAMCDIYCAVVVLQLTLNERNNAIKRSSSVKLNFFNKPKFK